MRVLRRLALVGSIPVVLSACALTYPRFEPGFELAEPALIDRAACEEEGGQILRVDCMTQFKACVVTYKDAGSPCRDSSECLGLCLSHIEPRPDPGTPTEGRCQVNNDPCRCFVEVSDGRVLKAWCVD